MRIHILISTVCLLLLTGMAQAQHRVATDEVAYSHLFMVFATPTPGAADGLGSASQSERHQAYVEHIGLNPAQGEILRQVAGEYNAYLEGLRAEATAIAGPAVPGAQLKPAQRARLKALIGGKRQILARLIQQLHASMDQQGGRIVRDYVNTKVKPNITFMRGNRREN